MSPGCVHVATVFAGATTLLIQYWAGQVRIIRKDASCGICSRQGLRYGLAFGERFAGQEDRQKALRPCYAQIFLAIPHSGVLLR